LKPEDRTTEIVLNSVMSVAAGIFALRVILGILQPDVSNIARSIGVRIDGANTGSGTIVGHQGDRYFVLTNWHVVDSRQTAIVQTHDGNRYVVKPNFIRRIPKLDLAVLEFISRSRYRVADIGRSDRLVIGQTLYVSGWADPTPQINDRSYQFLVGNLSGRIATPQDGYSLAYTVSALPGMSGGPILTDRGQLVGIHGRAITDLRTGTVNLVLGIDIDRFLGK
jgi:S1-C subfamily serine protease